MLQLPKFSGNVLEWSAFYDAFVPSDDSHNRLSNVQTFTHLRSCLYGRAYKCIEGYSLTNAARVICLVPKFNHISPYLKDLHWLPVELRIEFKILLLVFKALNGIATRYICDLIRKKASTRSSLRSNDLTLLEVPRTKCKTFGDRAFAFAGPSR